MELHANIVLGHLTGATLLDDVIANFQFQRLGPYWQRNPLNYLFYNVKHYKSVYQHLSTPPAGKGNCLLAFKTNQEDFISNKGPNIFPPRQTEGRGKVFFGA